MKNEKDIERGTALYDEYFHIAIASCPVGPNLKGV